MHERISGEILQAKGFPATTIEVAAGHGGPQRGNMSPAAILAAEVDQYVAIRQARGHPV